MNDNNSKITPTTKKQHVISQLSHSAIVRKLDCANSSTVTPVQAENKADELYEYDDDYCNKIPASCLTSSNHKVDSDIDIDSDDDDDDHVPSLEPPRENDLLGIQKYSCKELYLANQNSKILLLAMAQGLPNGIADLKSEAYKNKRRSFVPSVSKLRDEILRRSDAMRLSDANYPKCSFWSKDKCLTWLESNPVKNTNDVLFLTKEIKDFCRVLKNASDEKDNNCNEDAWYGNLPYLRLYHVMMEDKIREKYLQVHATLDRAQLDARNSEVRPPDFYEMASAMYNDPLYNPETNVYPDLHDDFKHSIMLLSTECPSVTPLKIKEKLADVRAKLVIIISNYERSGNGEGNRSSNCDEYGDVCTVTYTDDKRHNFLNGNKSHLLYFWQVLEETGILQKTLCILPKNIAASTSELNGTPTTIGKKQQRDNDDGDNNANTKKFQKTIQVAFSMIAKSSQGVLRSTLQTECSDLGKVYLEYRKQYSDEPEGSPDKEVLKGMMDDALDRYVDAKERLSKSKAVEENEEEE